MKSDRELESGTVTAKAAAAREAVQHFNVDERVKPHKWHYLLVGESDVAHAKGSWAALKKLGR